MAQFGSLSSLSWSDSFLARYKSVISYRIAYAFTINTNSIMPSWLYQNKTTTTAEVFSDSSDKSVKHPELFTPRKTL